MGFIFQRIFSELLLPPFAPFCLLIVAWLVAFRYRKLSLLLGTVAVLLFFVSGLSIIANRLGGPWPPVPVAVKPPYPPADAIVVLGGGRYINAREYAGDTAGPSTLERVRYAAKIFRETGKPILVTGGMPGGIGERSEGEIMRDILKDEFHVPVRWVENQAQESKQNAHLSAPLLKEAGVKRIYLITHGSHMPRAEAEFISSGFDVVPMITGFIGPGPETIFSWMPSFDGLANNRALIYEFLARIKPF
jgi:uncharacterized SAM-binding protein YcdF (DUF218 family)